MIANGFENMDKERLRKRPRMTWDEAPAEPEVPLLLPFSFINLWHFEIRIRVRMWWKDQALFLVRFWYADIEFWLFGDRLKGLWLKDMEAMGGFFHHHWGKMIVTVIMFSVWGTISLLDVSFFYKFMNSGFLIDKKLLDIYLYVASICALLLVARCLASLPQG